MGIEKLSRRKRPSGWRPHRYWCLAWLVLCQFPIPVAHSHLSLAGLDPAARQAHLQNHHPELCGDYECQSAALNDLSRGEEDVHWHWMLPWELSIGGVDDLAGNATRAVVSPLGVWCGAAGIDTLVLESTTGADSAESLHSAAGWLQNWSHPALELAAYQQVAEASFRPTLWTSFTQSYVGVPLSELIGVCLV